MDSKYRSWKHTNLSSILPVRLNLGISVRIHGHMLPKLRSFIRKYRFNSWYFQTPPWDTGISPPELLEYLDHHPPARALDLGCGSGTNVITLARYGWQVTGVDYAPRAIQIAQKKIKDAGVSAELYVDDVTRLGKISGSFEFILDIGCLHSVFSKRRPAYFANLDRLLADKGTYLLYAFWYNDDKNSDRGLRDNDIDTLKQYLLLDTRLDGTERGRRSTWFTFRKNK